MMIATSKWVYIDAKIIKNLSYKVGKDFIKLFSSLSSKLKTKELKW